MNERLKSLSEKLRGMTSQEAADWLLDNYDIHSPNVGDVYTLVQHRSWRRKDQRRLAKKYLSNLPHASDRGYRAFLSFMAIPVFLDVLGNCCSLSRSEIDLLLYYLLPALHKNAKNASDKREISKFIADLNSSG